MVSLQTNLSSNSAQSALRRYLFLFKICVKKPAIRYVLIDAAMWCLIGGVAVPICTHLFGHTEYSSFLGTMIGFVGGTGRKNSRSFI